MHLSGVKSLATRDAEKRPEPMFGPQAFTNFPVRGQGGINQDLLFGSQVAGGGPVNFMAVHPAPKSPEKLREAMLEITVRPEALGFVPVIMWNKMELRLNELVSDYFRARSSRKIRFEHKLWNALALTRSLPEFYSLIGVTWVSSAVFKVDKDIFGRLLAVTRPGSAFFSQRGSFVSHGFREVSVSEARQLRIADSQLTDVDEVVVRLFRHSLGLFRSDSSVKDINECTWSRFE
jgi:hypothetical protein